MLKVGLCLTGVCPERALSRMARSGITLFDVQKKDASTLHFFVKKADEKKVFALYPHVGYGQKNYAYATRRLPSKGGLKVIEKLKNRLGILLGAIAFVAVTQAGEGYVWKVDLDAPKVYSAQIKEVLEKYGIKQYARYQKGKEDLICSALLSLDGVSYCSVKKSGAVLYVALKTNSFVVPEKEKDFLAERQGRLQKLVVLRGTPLLKEGEEVTLQTRLVEGALYTAEGKREEVKIIAYAEIACVYAGTYECESEEEAFAKAYLEGALTEQNARVQAREIKRIGNNYQVTISYIWTQSQGM